MECLSSKQLRKNLTQPSIPTSKPPPPPKKKTGLITIITHFTKSASFSSPEQEAISNYCGKRRGKKAHARSLNRIEMSSANVSIWTSLKLCRLEKGLTGYGRCKRIQ